MLARAPRTEAELEARLVDIGYQPSTASATVERCRELGYVGDPTYARERARSLRARGCGELRIAADLGARGLPEPLIALAVDESREGLSERDLARRALGRWPRTCRRRRRARGRGGCSRGAVTRKRSSPTSSAIPGWIEPG
jgi:SOS response regulatory protein OraA/RecX